VPVLYVLLVVAELFNAVQALGFWWTCSGERRRRRPRWEGAPPAVDVLVPVYDEPVAVVEPTIAAAVRLRSADVRVHVLDDGGSDAIRNDGRRLVGKLTSGGLPPDWAQLQPYGITPAAAPGGATPRYAYDALRVPLRFAESCAAADRALAARGGQRLATSLNRVALPVLTGVMVTLRPRRPARTRARRAA
jgi:hypothetical protein